MTNDSKTTFEFDPLPGDQPHGQEKIAGAAPAEPKKRGRKPKAEKKERKKRGPRRVGATASITPVVAAAATVLNEDLSRAAVAYVPLAKKPRKPRQPRTSDEYDFIKQLLALTEAARKRVLEAINKVFG